MQTAYHELTATRLLQGYREKEFTPVEVTKACLERITDLNSIINAFCLIDEEAALASAEQSAGRWEKGTPEGQLDGVPVSIKDLLLAKNWPTLRGSHVTPKEGPWTEDSPPVARIREAGGVLLGKTTTPEFAWKGVTDSPLTGVTKNPWNIAYTPGGSSGGASAAVAAGMGPLALGTDAGGSLRIPAAMCGLFTIKPTGGRVPSYPPTPYGSFAATGPISWSVEDAALLLTVLSGDDWRDGSALPPPGEDFLKGLHEDCPRLRIGWSPDLGFAHPQPDVLGALKTAIYRLKELGHSVEEVPAPFDDPTGVYEDLRTGMTVSAFARLGEAQFAEMDPGLVAHIRESRATANLERYLAADAARARICGEMRRYHMEYDLLLTPALACAAFETGIDGPADLPESRLWSPFTFPFNLTRQPAVTLPCGFDTNDLPLAVQLVGPLYSEKMLLQLSRQYELAHPWERARATPGQPA
ncbi:MAG: amidase [Alphaproteobacteria bacterium]|nr:MAG: amidase [Alphaproteobacteria bacterium]